MFNVIKRDGEVAAFQLSKITQAIEKAFQAQEKQYTPDMMEMLGLRVTADFQKKIKKDQVSVEDIQDSVENVLIQCGYSEVAKAYILYRKQREKVRNMKQLCESRRLACKRKFYGYLFRRRTDLKQFRSSNGKLLVV